MCLKRIANSTSTLLFTHIFIFLYSLEIIQMKLFKNLFKTAITLTVGFSVIQQLPAHAATFRETTDAGQSLTNFQSIKHDTNAIIGSIGDTQDIDLYQINLADGLFAATTVRNVTNNLDTMLWLFDAEGKGVVGNDDSYGTSQSTIRASVEQGTYYLGIGNFGMLPTGETGSIFDYVNGSSRTKLLKATGDDALTDWDMGKSASSPQATGRYRIVLNQSTVRKTPEPSAAIGFGVFALSFAIKRSKAKKS
jgi:hypothetical protein